MPVYEYKIVDGKEVVTIVSEELQLPTQDPPKCGNCQTIISCGCQFRAASDGTKVCDECIDSYEDSLNS